MRACQLWECVEAVVAGQRIRGPLGLMKWPNAHPMRAALVSILNENRAIVVIYLLHTVSRLALETIIALLSIDQDVAADDSHRDTSGEHVEQRSFT